MKTGPDHPRLIDDVIAEASPENFADAVLVDALGCARRRRVRRKAGVATFTALVVGAASLVGVRWLRTPQTESRPVSAYAVVTTRALEPGAIIRSAPFAGGVVTTQDGAIAVVTTQPGSVRPIGDRELLALAGPDGAVLVAIGPHRKKLVCVAGGQ